MAKSPSLWWPSQFSLVQFVKTFGSASKNQ
nr:MAG TPA: hypothetical protein [Caudoviricetes sp.]DAN50637.1 MAG TPA: hypothetical protein [Caudoviricetes sp.]DAR17372.1 MAG TPA: hypothetical protein [Caudoviricetes sp.]DAX29585.1 MAG TPA: hypothetical protein [Caudoviricetes sp.]